MIRNKCDGNIFQWDTNLVLDVPASDIVYVDFQSSDVIRVAVEDGSCRIPDEILETAGKKILWLCHDDQTREQFIFNVKARPMPPDHITTPTQRITFDSLVRDVRTSIEEADVALGAMMTSVEREVGDKMSSVDAKMDQVDEYVLNALASAQEATERAEDASEGAEMVNVESERVDDGVMVKTTDREGNQTVTLVRDGKDIPYDDTEIRQQIATINQTLSEKMEFYPVLLKQAPLRFVHMDGDVETVLQYTDLESKYRDQKYFLYCEYDLITFIPSLPPDDDPVHDVNVMEFAGVWHYDGLQRITAIKINENNEIKIEETVVPKDIQLGGVSVLSNGVANILTNADVGTQVYQNSSGRYIAVRCATDSEIASHNSNVYKPIPVGKVVSAVDSVLCSTNANEALTPAQKTAFWNRVEKEWVLKGTLNTENKSTGVNVDLTGCT